MVENIVYVLGAGASNDAGGPLVKDFFSKSRPNDEAIYSRYFNDNPRYQILEKIYRDWAKKNRKNDIENYLKHIEYQKLSSTQCFDPISNKKYSPDLIWRYLMWYIASYVLRSVTATRNPPAFYEKFAESLKARGKRFSIITFNYDMVFERAIIRKIGAVDYGLGRIRGLKEYTSESGIPFLKLHGSLNWRICDKCGTIEVSEKPVAQIYPRRKCSSRCQGMMNPAIVPPAANKGDYLKDIAALWKKAHRTMEKADKLIIIGYSLPEVDTDAQGLLRYPIKERGIDVEIILRNAQKIKEVAERMGLDSNQLPLPYSPVPMDFKEFVKYL